MFKQFILKELVNFTKELTILYVEDNEEAQESVLALLENFFDTIIVASDGEEALEKFEAEHIDCIISDIKMPKLNGIEMSKKIREKDCTIPIIIATAYRDIDLLTECIKVGVSGYLLKPINLQQLEQVIKQSCEKLYYIKKTKEYESSLEKLVTLKIKELELSKLKLEEMVVRDPMTNLYNRRYFSEVSETLLSISKREKKPFSMLIIDIDKFKNINDTLGHLVGDKVIEHLADIMTSLTRAGDVVVRFGGEEFVILLPNTDEKGAYEFGVKLKEFVHNTELKYDVHSEKTLQYTISIGVACSAHDESISINKLIHRADVALYEAKESGRNRVIIYKDKS